MFDKILNIFFFLSLIFFVLMVSKYYFSEENVIFTNKSRSTYALENNGLNEDLPILKSDTKDIIIYKDGLEDYKKKKREWIWEDLISGNNE